MRIPHVHKLQLDPSEKRSEEVIKVDIQPSEYYDDLGLFDDPKEQAKWLFRIKSMIRHSYELEEMISFCKRKRSMDRCGIHPNLTLWDGHRIELHHTPFTITDIITIVTKRRMDKGASMKMQMIADEVVEIHYLGMVGLYPLCQLCHAIAHSDDNPLFIPLSSVFGNPEKFVELYKPFMTDNMKEKWGMIEKLNQGYSIINANLPEILQKKYIYIQNEDGSFSDHISQTKLADFIVQLNTAG